MAGLYFEEFSVGHAFDHDWTRTVTEMDNVLFSSLTMNVQPLHLDEEFASRTEFDRMCAPRVPATTGLTTWFPSSCQPVPDTVVPMPLAGGVSSRRGDFTSHMRMCHVFVQ